MHLILQNKEGKFANTKLENGIIIPGFTSNITNYVKDIKFISHKRRRKKFCLYCKSQTNGLMLIVCVYIILFSIASVILVMSVLRLQRLNVSEDNHNSLHHEVNYNMNNFEFKEIKNLLSKRLYKEFRWPFKSSVFNCSNLSYVKKFKYLTSGWTKNVFSFEYSGKNYALKSVNINGMDMQNCMKNYTKKACFEKASLKMYKEYVLSRELFHTNIMKVMAWCISSSYFFNEVAIITELCTPIDIILLLRLSFKQRLKIMLDLSQLMVYLAYSPLGSIAINDFQRQQFVLCGNTLKLTDLDDLSTEEPKCNDTVQCNEKKLIKYLNLNENYNYELKCVQNYCLGYNEKRNVANAYKHFVNLFLNITTPKVLKKNLEDLFNSYTSTWDAKIVHRATEKLYLTYNKFHNNKYLI